MGLILSNNFGPGGENLLLITVAMWSSGGKLLKGIMPDKAKREQQERLKAAQVNLPLLLPLLFNLSFSLPLLLIQPASVRRLLVGSKLSPLCCLRVGELLDESNPLRVLLAGPTQCWPGEEQGRTSYPSRQREPKRQTPAPMFTHHSLPNAWRQHQPRVRSSTIR